MFTDWLSPEIKSKESSPIKSKTNFPESNIFTIPCFVFCTRGLIRAVENFGSSGTIAFSLALSLIKMMEKKYTTAWRRRSRNNRGFTLDYIRIFPRRSGKYWLLMCSLAFICIKNASLLHATDPAFIGRIAMVKLTTISFYYQGTSVCGYSCRLVPFGIKKCVGEKACYCRSSSWILVERKYSYCLLLM